MSEAHSIICSMWRHPWQFLFVYLLMRAQPSFWFYWFQMMSCFLWFCLILLIVQFLQNEIVFHPSEPFLLQRTLVSFQQLSCIFVGSKKKPGAMNRGPLKIHCPVCLVRNHIMIRHWYVTGTTFLCPWAWIEDCRCCLKLLVSNLSINCFGHSISAQL